MPSVGGFSRNMFFLNFVAFGWLMSVPRLSILHRLGEVRRWPVVTRIGGFAGGSLAPWRESVSFKGTPAKVDATYRWRMDGMKAKIVLALITVGFCITPIASATDDFEFSFTGSGGDLLDNDINLFTLFMGPEILEIKSIELEITGLSHSYPDDLDIFLIDPALTNDFVLIMSDVGGTGTFEIFPENPVNLIFSDEATDVLPDEGQIVSGTYKPQGLAEARDLGMGNYIGVSGGGPQPWLLVVIDDALDDVGSFESFTLRGTYVPEPATLSLLAFGALAILHRRRR